MSKETITETMLQEVIFDLYDVYNGKITKLSKEYAKELAEKLEEVEDRLNTKGYRKTMSSKFAKETERLLKWIDMQYH